MRCQQEGRRGASTRKRTGRRRSSGSGSGSGSGSPVGVAVAGLNEENTLVAAALWPSYLCLLVSVARGPVDRGHLGRTG